MQCMMISRRGERNVQRHSLLVSSNPYRSFFQCEDLLACESPALELTSCFCHACCAFTAFMVDCMEGEWYFHQTLKYLKAPSESSDRMVLLLEGQPSFLHPRNPPGVPFTMEEHGMASLGGANFR